MRVRQQQTDIVNSIELRLWSNEYIIWLSQASCHHFDAMQSTFRINQCSFGISTTRFQLQHRIASQFSV